MKKIGLFTGSFDPVTIGHMDLIKRASHLFDQLLVGVCYNPHKKNLISLEQRATWLTDLTQNLTNVQVITSQKELVVELAKRHQVTHLVRGLRDAKDLDYEASFDFYNRQLAPELETIYLLAKPEYKWISSSGVRELLTFKAATSAYVPDLVERDLEKLRER